MGEDAFRLVVSAAIALAAAAFVAQAIAMIGLYRAARKIHRTVESLSGRAGPVLGQVSTAVENIQMLQERALPVIQKVGPLLDRAVPLMDKAGPVIERAGKVVGTAQQILDENRPRISELSTEALGLARTGRGQVERFGELLNDAGERARARLVQIDETVGSTVGQIEQASESVKRAVLRPVREVNGIAAGFSAVISTLVRGRKYPVDAATQDEEMFI